LHKEPIKFVITAALKQELPLELLEPWGIKVVTSKALSSGILNSRGLNLKSSALAVITGVGPDRAREAARAICQVTSPLFVLNLGSCGLVKGPQGPSSYVPGRVVIPNAVSMPTGEVVGLEPGLPFVLEDGLAERAPLLETRPEPLFDPSGPGPCLVDMEAAPQALVFSQRNIPFYTVKVISDLCSGPEKYMRNLERVRRGLDAVLNCLLPGPSPRTDQGGVDVSVVIPVRNRAGLVIRAVESVLSQRLAPRQVIVVDDCSRDGTAEAVRKEFGQQVKLISLMEPGGVSMARNIGIEAADSSWIALLDSDDEWRPNMLESMWGYLARNPFFQILQAEEIWIRRGRRVNRKRYHEKKEGWIWDISLERCMISPSAVLFKKALFERFGPFDQGFPACEDYDLWLRITRYLPIGLDPNQGLVKYGGHDDQLSRSVPVLDWWRVRALGKALEAEGDPARRKALAKAMKRRLEILIQGAERRGKVQDCMTYRQLLARVEEECSG
jgi:nucleoside phosphorylase